VAKKRLPDGTATFDGGVELFKNGQAILQDYPIPTEWELDDIRKEQEQEKLKRVEPDAQNQVTARKPQTASSTKKKSWLTEREYADEFNVPRQTLCNWRHLDKKSGRTGAAPGQPVYRKFGTAVRYYVERVPPEVPPALSRDLD